ncbi:Ig-like domain-containing protein [Paenibacillus chungangensis]|uniref:Ig-like domain-containing protein n=2 Tax=Paenibacillus chungangensis TaxID=696535 RepID=A0ABW3HTY1_9BACL
MMGLFMISVITGSLGMPVYAEPDAPAPTISAHPQDANVDQGAPSITLSVTANGSGTLSYQWIRNSTNSYIGGNTINGATSATYDIPTSTPRDEYYYVIVTNTDNSVSGINKATTRSDFAHVTVNALANAAVPVISAHPQDANVDQGAPSITLSVTASGSGSGTLSYQWMRNSTNSYIGGSTINGATSATYDIPTSTPRDEYYYVVVTNTDNSVSGINKATTRSDFAHVTVNALANAADPVISAHPQDANVDQGAPSVTLSVTASASGSGTLSYQWMRNSTNSYIGGNTINGATSATYDIPTSTPRDEYYYVVVTNTDNSVSGINKATTRSDFAHVTVNALANAADPVISAHPQDANVDQGAPSVTLSVTASASGSGTLSYQWMRNSTNSYIGGNTINGATSATYDIPTSTPRDEYYYVVVKNTDNSVSGAKTATARSDFAHVTVNALANASAPTISDQPVGGIVHEYDTVTLGVTASASGSGTLSYQWVRNSTNSYIGGNAINGATSSTYDVPTSYAHNDYYYVVVTNTDNSVPGTKTASTRSDFAHVTVLDVTPPSVSISSAQANPTNASSFPVKIAFSEAVTGFDLADIAVTNGSASNLVMNNSRTFTAMVTPSTEGEVRVNVAAGVAADAAMNSNTAATEFSVTYDTTAPTAIITSTEPDPTTSKPFSVTIAFSEAVTGFAVGDIAVTNGTASNLSTADNMTYRADITPVAHGEVKLNLAAGTTIDAAGNDNIAAAEFTIAYDGTAPRVSDYYPEDEATSVGWDDDLKLVFSENVTAVAGKSIVIKKMKDDSIVESIAAADTSKVTIAGAEVVVNVETLHSGTGYYVQIDAGAFKDVENTEYAGILDKTSWNFMTVAASRGPSEMLIGTSVNGKEVDLGSEVVNRSENYTKTTIMLDDRSLMEKLKAVADGAVITIKDRNDSDLYVTQLSGQLLRYLKEKQVTLEFKTEYATYTLPAQLINMEALAAQLGENISSENVGVRVELVMPSAGTVNTAENAAKEGSFELAANPVSFRVIVTHGDSSVEVDTFKAYVERTLLLPESVDRHRVTTGVVINSDGTVRHVPTSFEVINGRQYAIINSLTNSSYALVWNPVQFGDMSRHWAKDAVNDMGSRMVINGTGDGNYTPDTNITRAEFAAIIVRALGMKPQAGTTPFSDVQASDWYSGAVNTAHAYRLIAGYDDGTFRPNEKITREQATTIMAEAMAITGLYDQYASSSAESALNKYADASDVSPWAKQSLAVSLQVGVIQGRSGLKLAPQAFVTRAEVAVMVERLLKRSGLI